MAARKKSRKAGKKSSRKPVKKAAKKKTSKKKTSKKKASKKPTTRKTAKKASAKRSSAKRKAAAKSKRTPSPSGEIVRTRLSTISKRLLAPSTTSGGASSSKGLSYSDPAREAMLKRLSR